MPVHNTEIAEVLNRTAELFEIKDANPFRARAYRNAARIVLETTAGGTGLVTVESAAG
jgi:DNA polymerase/3'-5' exonuclease PolX